MNARHEASLLKKFKKTFSLPKALLNSSGRRVCSHTLICWEQHSCVPGFPSFICFNWINNNSSNGQILHIIWTCQYFVSFRTELTQSRTSPFQHQKIDLTCEWIWSKNHIIWFFVNNLKNTQWNINLFSYYEIIIKSFSILHTLFNCVLPASYFAYFFPAVLYMLKWLLFSPELFFYSHLFIKFMLFHKTSVFMLVKFTADPSFSSFLGDKRQIIIMNKNNKTK